MESETYATTIPIFLSINCSMSSSLNECHKNKVTIEALLYICLIIIFFLLVMLNLF